MNVVSRPNHPIKINFTCFDLRLSRYALEILPSVVNFHCHVLSVSQLT
jgi:hypothetical protein